jgi:transcriptional regulator GlxA family with amidase domain
MQSIHIVFMLFDRMLATSCALPMEMLFAAQNAAERMTPSDQRPQTHIQTISDSLSPLTTQTNIIFQPELTYENEANANIIYIPSLWRNPRPVVRQQQAAQDWLKKQHENGAIISAVGTGVCLLAETGLLDNKAATTHWHYFDQFQKDYPNINLKRQHFITQADNLFCAASVNSLADLSVHFIQRLYGKTVASHVERNFSHEIRKPYNASLFFESDNCAHPDEQVTQLQIWLQDNVSKDIHLPALAARFDMSVRTLNRRFKSATGKSPIEYLHDIRVNTAKELLKNSNLSIDEIAEKVGYQDSSYFNKLFKRHLATTASEYRKIVRGKLFHT